MPPPLPPTIADLVRAAGLVERNCADCGRRYFTRRSDAELAELCPPCAGLVPHELAYDERAP